MTSTKLILKQVITFPSRSGAYSHNKLLIIVWVGSEQIKPMKTKFSIVEGQFIGRPLPLPLFAVVTATVLCSFHCTGAENRRPYVHSARVNHHTSLFTQTAKPHRAIIQNWLGWLISKRQVVVGETKRQKHIHYQWECKLAKHYRSDSKPQK